MKPILFSDIDGTLIFHHRSKNCLQIPNENKFIHPETVKIIHQMMTEGWIIALDTGRRQSSFNNVSDLIPHHYAFIEHGGIFLDSDKKQLLVSQKDLQHLSTLKNKLLNLKFDIDDAREISFRIMGRDGKKLAQADIQQINDEVNQSQYSARATLNEGYIDVMPKNVGKEKAIESFQSRFGADNRVYAMGNDFSDLELLKSAYFSACPKSSEKVIIKAVTQSKGYIPEGEFHEGTYEILSKFREDYHEI